MRSPFEVPIPTHSAVSPLEPPVGALGSTSVDVASRIQERPPTGPRLNAGPKSALTLDVSAAAARVETRVRGEGIFGYVYVIC
jgi:hypothetical protein